MVLGAVMASCCLGGTAQARPPDDVVDQAFDCLARTRVAGFGASPDVVDPFVETTLSWQVQVPTGCGVSLWLAGHHVAPSGTLRVTPRQATTDYILRGSMLGVQASLATTQVRVDQRTCRTLTISETLLATQIRPILDELDAADDDFYQVKEADIQLQPGRLAITMFMKVSRWWWWDPSVTLQMRIRFTVRDGVVDPAWVLFRPDADTSLPDDFVESEFYGRADDILADLKSRINELVPTYVPTEDKLFDVVPAEDEVAVTTCNDPSASFTVPDVFLPLGIVPPISATGTR